MKTFNIALIAAAAFASSTVFADAPKEGQASTTSCQVASGKNSKNIKDQTVDSNDKTGNTTAGSASDKK
jgi:hypothetical protein